MSKSKKKKQSEYVSTIEGYYRETYRIGEGVVKRRLSLYPTYEYWSFWYKKDGIKLKKTKLPPRQMIDNYGWKCKKIYQVGTIVELDKPKTIVIKTIT